MRLAVILALVSFGVAASHFATSAGSELLTGPCPKSTHQGVTLGSIKLEDSDVVLRAGGHRKLGATGDTFNAGDVLCTSVKGAAVVTFKHSGRTAKCHLHPGAAIRLAIAKTDFVQVTLWSILGYGFGVDFECGGKGLNLDTGQVHLVAADPLFSVSGDSRSLVVKVARGLVKVNRPPSASGAPSSPTTFVGPMEKSVAPAGGAPAPAQAIPPQALFSLVTSPVAVGKPLPGFGRPTVRRAMRSRALQRIRKRNLIVVGLAPGLEEGSEPGNFVRNYFQFLGQQDHWAVKAVFTPVTKRMNLSNGGIDVFVGQTAGKGTSAAPFFGDHARRNWLLVVDPDPVFLEALTSFLESAINTGDYGRIYLTATKQLPVYKVVAPLVFPPQKCTPRPNADLTSPVDLKLTMTASPSGLLRAGAKVHQTVTVTNTGARVVDCVTLQLHIFGAGPLDKAAKAALGAAGCALPGSLLATGELEVSCELGRFELGKSKSVQVITQPASGSSQHRETCADVDADESGGMPEIPRGDNGACVEFVYRPPSKPFVVGVVEDQAKEPPAPEANIPLPLGGLDPKAKFDLLGRAGFGAVVLTAGWVRGETAPSLSEIAKLQNAVMAANLDGMEVVLAVYNFGKGLTAAQDTPVTQAERADFAAYAAALARALPTVREFIVGNEPNNETFWSPQYGPDNSDVAASKYEALLAKTYDALKAVDPTIEVIGGALSPRGVTKPKPGVHDTHSPISFIADLGAAYGITYRKGTRTKPIMDAFALHPIPESRYIPPSQPHPSSLTVLGIADYPVLVSLLGRAFDGTAQLGTTLPIYYTEYAIQTAPKAPSGGKPDAPVSEATQADYYRQAIALASCQPSVEGIFFFHGFDEPRPAGWQSGVYYANGTPKSSLLAVRQAAIAARTPGLLSCPPPGG